MSQNSGSNNAVKPHKSSVTNTSPNKKLGQKAISFDSEWDELGGDSQGQGKTNDANKHAFEKGKRQKMVTDLELL